MTAPGAPRPPELTALPGRIEVGWSAPESDGGSAVTGYVATATPGGASPAPEPGDKVASPPPRMPSLAQGLGGGGA